MAVRAYLYNSNGTDQEVQLDSGIVSSLNDSQVLWVDVSEFEESEIRQLAKLFDLQSDTLEKLMKPDSSRPRLDNYGKYFQLNVNVIHLTNEKFTLADLSFVISSNLLITVHPLPIAFSTASTEGSRGTANWGSWLFPHFLQGCWIGTSPVIFV